MTILIQPNTGSDKIMTMSQLIILMDAAKDAKDRLAKNDKEVDFHISGFRVII